MPRPKTREGNSEQFCIKVSLDLFEAIDAARGILSRAEWARRALLAAAERRPDPLGIKIVSDERIPPGTAALVSRGRDRTSVSAFSLAADLAEPPASAKSRTGGCPHRLPAGAYCKTCGAK